MWTIKIFTAAGESEHLLPKVYVVTKRLNTIDLFTDSDTIMKDNLDIPSRISNTTPNYKHNKISGKQWD